LLRKSLVRAASVACILMGVFFGYDFVSTPKSIEILNVVKTHSSDPKKSKGGISYSITAVGNDRYVKGFSKSNFEYFKVGQKLKVSISYFTDEWMKIEILQERGGAIVVPDSRPFQTAAFSLVLLVIGALGIFGRDKLLLNKFFQGGIAVCGIFSSIILLKMLAVGFGYFTHV